MKLASFQILGILEGLPNAHPPDSHCTCFGSAPQINLFGFPCREGWKAIAPSVCKHPHLPIRKDSSRSDLVRTYKGRNVHVAHSEEGALHLGASNLPSAQICPRRAKTCVAISVPDSVRHSASPMPWMRRHDVQPPLPGHSNCRRRRPGLLVLGDEMAKTRIRTQQGVSPDPKQHPRGMLPAPFFRETNPRLTPSSSSTSLSSTSPRVPIVGMP